MIIRKSTKYYLILPLFAIFFGLMIFPTVFGWYLSFNEVFLSTFNEPVFNGIKNYINVLSDRMFAKSLIFTFKFALLVTLAELIIGLGLAILFNRKIQGKRFFISLLLLPMMVAPALIGIMYRLLLNEFIGPVSYYLGKSLLVSQYVIPTVIIIDVLQWSPFAFLILYAALQTIPKEYYEAASIEGAGGTQKFWYITLPRIWPFIIMVLLLRGIDSFKSFDMINVLTSGGPGSMTTTVSIYIYKLAFQSANIGKSAAASLLLLLFFSLPLTLALRKIYRGAE